VANGELIRHDAPHRTTRYCELCRECRGRATGLCPRCQRPLCAEHLRAGPGLRCPACESRFAELAGELDEGLEVRASSDAIVVGAAAGMIAATAATLGALVFWDQLPVVLMVILMIGLPLAHVIGGPLVRALRAHRARLHQRRLANLRSAFLRERRPLATTRVPPSSTAE
jgi:hypothetical protein